MSAGGWGWWCGVGGHLLSVFIPSVKGAVSIWLPNKGRKEGKKWLGGGDKEVWLTRPWQSFYTPTTLQLDLYPSLAFDANAARCRKEMADISKKGKAKFFLFLKLDWIGQVRETNSHVHLDVSVLSFSFQPTMHVFFFLEKGQMLKCCLNTLSGWRWRRSGIVASLSKLELLKWGEVLLLLIVVPWMQQSALKNVKPGVKYQHDSSKPSCPSDFLTY